MKVGDQGSLRVLVTEEKILGFAALTYDDNPIHIYEEVAKKSRFKKRVAHGLFILSLIGAVLGTQNPGRGSIYLSQSIKFLHPVFINDWVEVFTEITKIEGKKVWLKTWGTVKDKKVIDGEALMLYEE